MNNFEQNPSVKNRKALNKILLPYEAILREFEPYEEILREVGRKKLFEMVGEKVGEFVSQSPKRKSLKRKSQSPKRKSHSPKRKSRSPKRKSPKRKSPKKK